MRKLIATLLTISTLSVMGYSPNQEQIDGTDFSLIEYLETHEVESYSEFIDLVQTVHPDSADCYEYVPENISEFSIEIDYDDRTVSVQIIGEPALVRTQGASNSVSRSYYTDEGIKIFTVSVSGTFTYGTGYCNVISRDGSYTKPVYSTWNSSPTITSGSITTSKAYVRIYGIASSNGQSKSYTLTLTCDSTGHFTSY